MTAVNVLITVLLYLYIYYGQNIGEPSPQPVEFIIKTQCQHNTGTSIHLHTNVIYRGLFSNLTAKKVAYPMLQSYLSYAVQIFIFNAFLLKWTQLHRHEASFQIYSKCVFFQNTLLNSYPSSIKIATGRDKELVNAIMRATYLRITLVRILREMSRALRI